MNSKLFTLPNCVEVLMTLARSSPFHKGTAVNINSQSLYRVFVICQINIVCVRLTPGHGDFTSCSCPRAIFSPFSPIYLKFLAQSFAVFYASSLGFLPPRNHYLIKGRVSSTYKIHWGREKGRRTKRRFSLNSKFPAVLVKNHDHDRSRLQSDKKWHGAVQDQ